MFKEIAALAQPGALHLIIVMEGDKLGVTLNRKPGKDCTALSIHAKGSPEELDAEFVLAIAEGLAMHDAPDETKSVAEQVKSQMAAPGVVEPVVKEMGTPQAAASKSTKRKKRTPKAKAEPKAPKKARRPRVSKAPAAPAPEAPKTRRKRKAAPETNPAAGETKPAESGTPGPKSESIPPMGETPPPAPQIAHSTANPLPQQPESPADGGRDPTPAEISAPVRDTKTPDLFS